ncbi:MAG TPA: hypothetical protein VFW47_02410 [Phenylobacterium sp.]|nr:hypothetical protein [Phenylobacterium sp.]
MTIRTLVLLLAAGLAVAACDRAAPRSLHRAPVPVPAVDPSTPADAPPPREVAGPITWDAGKRAFLAHGRPLRAEKTWTFDGATDGFVAASGEALPADGSGLTVRELGPGVILRTPRGLNVDGRLRSLVVVRMTRVRPGRPFDGTVYYSTAAHGETQSFFAKPVFGGDPVVGQTQVLVYDMHRLRSGGDDWKSSIIDQVRLDLDATPGGEFLIHQVAIAQDPGDIFPPPPKPPEAKAPESRPDAEKKASTAKDQPAKKDSKSAPKPTSPRT